MNSISHIPHTTCFDAILRVQSWLPEDDENVAIANQRRLLILEKLLQCQLELGRALHEIHAIPIRSNDYLGLKQLLKRLKIFNDQTEIVENFLTCPFGQTFIPSGSELYEKIQERLDLNYKKIECKLQLTLNNLTPFLENKTMEIDLFNQLYAIRYDTLDFSPAYANLLTHTSPLQIKDWLRSSPQIVQKISTLPCYVIRRIFTAFQANLNCYSYPKGFFKNNRRVLHYYEKRIRIQDSAILSCLRKIEGYLNGNLIAFLTDFKHPKDVSILTKLIKAFETQKNRKQIINFLKEQSKETLAADLKSFVLFIQKHPAIKSRYWKNLLSLYRNHKGLVLDLIDQRCFKNKARRFDKFIEIGLKDPSYLRRLTILIQICSERRVKTFYRLAKKCAHWELMSLNPLVSFAFTKNDMEAGLAGLHLYSENPSGIAPLLQMPDEKQHLWPIIFKKLSEPSSTEVERIFEVFEESFLFQSLYHPYYFNPFILPYQERIKRNPELQEPFVKWLSKVLESKAPHQLELKNRTIPLRALEMNEEHILPFYQYASRYFYYRHLSHLLYLEKNCPSEFHLTLQLTTEYPEQLHHLTQICNRLGKKITSRILRSWEKFPDVMLKILSFHQLSGCFFEGILEFLNTDINRLKKYLALHEKKPSLLFRLDQDIHLFGSSFLNRVLNDEKVCEQFSQLMHGALPYMISHLIRQISESYEFHQELTVQALAISYKNPPALQNILILIQQNDPETKRMIEFLTLQPARIAFQLLTLWEHQEDRELARSIIKIIEERNDRSFGLRILDLAMDGFTKEANELATRFICCQHNDWNRALFWLASSQNGWLIHSALNWTLEQRQAFQPFLLAERIELKPIVEIINRGHYDLLKAMRTLNQVKFSRSIRERLIAEELAKGNILTANWLLRHDPPKKTFTHDMIEKLLERVHQGSFYEPEEKKEALEVALAVGTALSLMTPAGVINKFLIPKIKSTILGQKYIPVNTDTIDYLLFVLGILEKDEEDLSIKFIQFKNTNKPLKPSAKQILDHFFDDEQDNDIRCCVLSALFFRPRQHNQLGNCFASQLSVQMGCSAKGLSLAADDYFEILSNSSLKRMDPFKNQIVEYRLPRDPFPIIKPYATDHPLVRARESLLTQMGADVSTVRLYHESTNLLHPKNRHNFLFRVMKRANSSESVIAVARTLQHSLKELSDVYYDALAIEPVTQNPGAWLLMRKDRQQHIRDVNEYRDFLVSVIEHAKQKTGQDSWKILDHTKEYLTKSTRFNDRLLSYYKRKKVSPNNTHWVDFSGGNSDGVRLRYYGCEHVVKTSRYIYNANDALREIFAFYERLSERVRMQILINKQYRVCVDYPGHSANLLLHELGNRSFNQVRDAMASEVDASRNLMFSENSYKNLIEQFRTKLPVSISGHWAHFMYQQELDSMSLGMFCDSCLKGLHILCATIDKQQHYVASFENLLRLEFARLRLGIIPLIDTNWRAKQDPFLNVYLGIGGSIFYQEPIFFCGTRNEFIPQAEDFARGQWDFIVPKEI